MVGFVTWLTRTHRIPLFAAGIYASFLLAMLVPSLQRHFLYLHRVRWPIFADFNNPARYGLSSFASRNLRIRAADGVELGMWHILPDSYLRALHSKNEADLPGSIRPTKEEYDEALRTYPTVIYLHGNAANRAAPFRIAVYKQLTSKLDVNVLAVDYRGFGDSQGYPTEEGLVLDARAVWDFLQARRKTAGGGSPAFSVPGEGVLVAGQSLGTGVASRLTQYLVREARTPPQGLVLIAPYSSLRELVTSYAIGGIFPIFGPLQAIPGSGKFIDGVLRTHFNTSSVLPTLHEALDAATADASSSYPHVVIVHATDDAVIPHSHSDGLFEAAVEAVLDPIIAQDPEAPPKVRFDGIQDLGGRDEKSKDKFKAIQRYITHYKQVRNQIVESSEIEGFGKVETIRIGANALREQGDAARRAPSFSVVRTLFGGHNHVGDGVIDLVAHLTGLQRK